MDLLKRIKQLFTKETSPRQDEEYGPDLFEYARMRAESLPGTGAPPTEPIPVRESGENRNRTLLILLLLLLLPLAYLLGILSGNTLSRCDMERYGILYSLDGSRTRAFLEDLGEGRLKYRAVDEGERVSEDVPAESVDVTHLTRIDFLPDPEPEPEEEGPPPEISPDVRKFLGRYEINVSGHRGDLFIYVTKKGYTGGTLKFSNWGRGVPEVLKWVRIRGTHISFVRSCNGAGCSRIGAGSPFRQVFNGELKNEGSYIEGTYTGGSNASGWEAKRK